MQFLLGMTIGALSGVCLLHILSAFIVRCVTDASEYVETQKRNGKLIAVPHNLSIIPADDRTSYIEMDKIRLVIEDGELAGWYDPTSMK